MRNGTAALRSGAAALFLTLVAPGVRAESLVATRPGLMCSSAEALGRLTLPDGSSRTAAARPRPDDLRLRAAGGCIDIPPGARVTVLEAYRNTSSVSFDAGDGGGPRTFTVPNIDFAASQATAPVADVVLGTSPRLGVTITANGPNWCIQTPTLHVAVEDPATFDSAEFRTLLQRFSGAGLSQRCPAAESVQYSGTVRGGPPRWQATASARTNWTLAPANTGTALNLDDLGGPAKPTQSPVQSTAQTKVRAPAQAAGPLPEPEQVASAFTPPRAPLPIGACPIAYVGSPEQALPMVCTCTPAAVDRGAVFGTDQYSFDSVPCRAARHAGVFGPEGGTAAFMPVIGPRNLVGSDRNGVDSGAVNNVATAVEVRPATPSLVTFIGDVTARAKAPALEFAVTAPDDRQLVAIPVPPPAYPTITTELPAPGVAINLPVVDAVSLPIPPPPLAGGLPLIPWQSAHAAE